MKSIAIRKKLCTYDKSAFAGSNKLKAIRLRNTTPIKRRIIRVFAVCKSIGEFGI